MPIDVTPWEAASGGNAVRMREPESARFCPFSIRGSEPGTFDIRLQYFDQNNGAAHYNLFVGKQLVDEWIGADTIPTTKIDAHSSTMRRVPGLALRTGDQIRIEGTPDGPERAALDYVEVTRSARD